MNRINNLNRNNNNNTIRQQFYNLYSNLNNMNTLSMNQSPNTSPNYKNNFTNLSPQPNQYFSNSFGTERSLNLNNYINLQKIAYLKEKEEENERKKELELEKSKNTNKGKKKNKKKNKQKFIERMGDWYCSNCGNLNFSFRNSCNRCQLNRNESENMEKKKKKDS